MGESIAVTHEHGERIAVACGAVELMSYVYRPDPVAFESPKPYAHPLRTLAGHVVTGYRPHDHRWHKGLQMTASHVSGQNFWGGNTYVPGAGYQELPERVGAMRHDAFDSVDVADDRLDLVERLTWTAHGGAEWAGERRAVSVHSVDPAAGTWVLDWSIELTNLCAGPLHFGSPTTAGREMAGYTGLHWRGPREFTGGDVLGPGDLGGEAMMGRQAPWLAFVGEHDAVDAHSTLVFAHAPDNDAAIHESHWFVRSAPIPVVAFSWAFFEEFALEPGARFRYRYRVLIADGAWDRARVERALTAHPW
ncbi:DUF6807 domain-containing protein [Salinifilum ghardaiensis]